MNSSKTSSKPAQDPYAVLGLDRRADDAAVKRAYFERVRKYPPESAPERFQEIRAAYEQLRSAERRARTDLFLLQPPPETPRRRAPAYDLGVHDEDLLRLAVEWAVAQQAIKDDFHEPDIPKQ
jgi:curved DNA-binding protein CbpA